MSKKNCWEYNNCGRAADGEKVERLGICPAAKENKLHNIHNGTNAGRACWVVPETLCGDTMQGGFAEKMRDCFKCDFYNYVAKVEGKKQVPASRLLKHLG